VSMGRHKLAEGQQQTSSRDAELVSRG
jgi:hypothetical protein